MQMLKGDMYDTFGYFWCYLYNIGCMKSSTIQSRVSVKGPRGPLLSLIIWLWYHKEIDLVEEKQQLQLKIAVTNKV